MIGFNGSARKRKGIIFILSAPSGAGKTTMINRLLRVFPGMTLSVSYTTRARRPGETAGIDYHFVSRKKFAWMRARGGFAEWASVHGHLYGTPRRPLVKSVRSGRDVLLDIDVKGARKIKRQYDDAVSTFLLPPSRRELRKRLARRGTDREDTIRRRLANARCEIAQMIRYDYVVVNRRIGAAVETLRAIVLAERHRVSRVKRTRGK